MKSKIYQALQFALVWTSSATAQFVDGTWNRGEQKLGYTESTNFSFDPPVTGRFFDNADLETESVVLNANGTFQDGSGSGQWFFNDGEVVIIDGSEVRSVIVSEQGDTIVHTGLEEIPFSAPSVQGDFRIFEIEVGMRQASALSTVDILGEWVLYRQQAVTTKRTIDGNEVEQLLRFKFSSERVFFSNATFTAEVLLDTENPDEVGNSFGSTWSLDGTSLRITVPGEGILAQDTISAGKDSAILIQRESESFPQGNLFEDEFAVWVKIAPSLVSADAVGTWRNVYMETIFDDDSGDDTIDYVDLNYGIEEFRLFTDGTARSRVLDGTNEATGTTEAFVWSIVNGNELLLTGADGSQTVQLSAGKDFGVLLQVEDSPGAGLDEYDYAMFIKQSDQPSVGFESNLPSIDVGSGISIAPEISLLSISGVYYQLQRKTDLTETEWSNVGSPVLGTGAPITLEDLSPPVDASFYRVTVVPAP